MGLLVWYRMFDVVYELWDLDEYSGICFFFSKVADCPPIIRSSLILSSSICQEISFILSFFIIAFSQPFLIYILSSVRLTKQPLDERCG